MLRQLSDVHVRMFETSLFLEILCEMHVLEINLHENETVHVTMVFGLCSMFVVGKEC